MYVQNTTVEALKLPWWRQITHNLEHYFLSGAPFMDSVFFPEDHRVSTYFIAQCAPKLEKKCNFKSAKKHYLHFQK